ncbi:ABC transporter ATP-binding protein [Paenibacillus sp. MMS20-IR301]|uniref:ABC transporter ATP-binding protein n=1 Tax=Paenibacillus sp. MMS20-IR301 TaxID=2895946 RepID=UPI0028E1EFC3|nr:ABC transporter ATP-binding protein [Paenibacillus sp. MMS20-IR301]WNS41493.1 ABC transporter ATP-binding protein [Paenibacillus sp. MMS20-IR301]
MESGESMTKRQWVTKFMLMHKWVFACGLFITTLMTMINLLYPFLNGRIINIAFYDKDMSAFLNLCLIYAGILVFNQFIVATLNNLISSQMMTGFVFDIRRALFNKVLHKKGKDLSGMYSGDMISRMNHDAADIMNLVFWSGLWGYSNLLHIVFAVGFMFYYNVFLGAFTVILVPVVFAASKYFKKRSLQINKEIREEQGKLSSYLFEIVKNLQEVRILNAGRKVRSTYLRKTTAINQMTARNGKVEVTTERVNAFIMLLAQLLIFIICAYFIVNGQMQLGVFVAAISYFNMAVTYFSSINSKITDVWGQSVSLQRVVDILNEEEEDYRENQSPVVIKEGRIEFNNVTFGYTGERAVLNGFNLCVDAGSTIGIVGRSGAGKTTMGNLLYNLYNVDRGELLIDGVNVSEYNLNSLRSQVGIVHQETILYDNTLRYNLSFSNNKDNDEALLDVIKKAALHEVVRTFPEGLDTMLGTGAQELSGGQKQRLAIARILIKNPKILIFDEATSFLDSKNEALIRSVMNELARDRTLLIIAHRFSTIRDCDKIAVLQDGVVAGYDTHDVLIRSNRTYIDLFSEQFAGGEAV